LTIPDDDPVLDVDTERDVAARLFNLVWDLLDLPSRTPDEDELMVNAAHASLYHWVRVGEPVNEARGEWQVSRVFAVLHRGEPALHHARPSLAVCERDGVEDFDLAFAYEAMSRAHMVGGDDGEASRFAAIARTAADRIADEEDRQIFLSDLVDLPGGRA
jgi:hypothetical protein